MAGTVFHLSQGVGDRAERCACFAVGVYSVLNTNHLMAADQCLPSPLAFATSSINSSLYFCYISCSLTSSVLKKGYDGSIKITRLRQPVRRIEFSQVSGHSECLTSTGWKTREAQ